MMIHKYFILLGLIHCVRSFQPLHSRQSGTRILNFSRRLFSTNEPKQQGLNDIQSFQWTNPSSSSLSLSLPLNSKRTQQRDVVIVGGGLAGLSAALFLSQMDPSRHVTVIDRENPREASTTAASFAAAGMLAPNAERLPRGELLELCQASRRIYTDFVDLVESLAKESGEEGQIYFDRNAKDGLEPWEVGFSAAGGFLAPAFAGDSVATHAPPEGSSMGQWLDAVQIRELEPNLHPDVIGGWWFPEDASVDARRLTQSLRAACVGSGVQILHGKSNEVTSLDLVEGTCKGVWLRNGKYFKAKSVLLATGAWMRNLLPVPVEPHKGQSLSLRMPKDQPPMLRRVLFAQDSYIVPKADGRIIVGSTVEAGTFDPHVTPAGLMHILSYATQLLPCLKDLPIEETWVGLRPTTPDKGPILGQTPWKNLFLAAGYWRNGVLLAPKTGQMLAALICGQPLSDIDREMLDAFSWDRFTSKDGGAKLAAASRYAASMYPVHRRKSGTGVAASVGTELGTYSTARLATDERKRDRSSLWNTEADDAFERAASMGREDGSVYSFGDRTKTLSATRYEGSGDAFTVGSSNKSSTGWNQPALEWAAVNNEKENATLDNRQEGDLTTKPDEIMKGEGRTVSGIARTKEPKGTFGDSASSDMRSVYQEIIDRKSKSGISLNEDTDEADEKQDPGFRIYHIDAETGEEHMVPPYTSPGEFLESLKRKKETSNTSEDVIPESKALQNEHTEYTPQTYDGYTVIQQANARGSRDEELEAMRAARSKNRLGQSSIKESDIGAQKLDS